jgi:hypothetical protein
MVAWLPWATPVWLSGSGLGFRREDTYLSPSISSFHCKEKQNKLSVLLVFDFSAPRLRVNLSLVGKQSLVFVTTELKLFPTT